MHLKLSSPILPYLFRALDFSIIILAGWVATLLKPKIYEPMIVENWSNYLVVVVVGALMFVFSWGDIYRSWRGSSILNVLKETYVRWFLVVGLLLIGIYISKSANEIARLWFLIWSILGMIFLSIERLSIYLLLRFLRRIGYNHRHVVIVGSGKLANQLVERIKKSTWSGYEVAQHLLYPDMEALESLESGAADEVWLALPLSDESLIKDVLYGLRHCSSSIRFVPDLFALNLINHGAVEIIGMTMLNLSASRFTGLAQGVKWLEDKIFSSIILLLISPIMIFLAIGVKLSSPGPVFYRQERVGLNNRSFMMLKFRSMPIDTESNGVRWGGSASKATNAFGQFIRKTSLDELPQFLNVLKGDMSIVGPRPERPMFVDEFKEKIPDYMKKHLVKAGITGWAQVNGWRGDTDLKERIDHDIFYIENWSFSLDLKIILMTFYKGFINKNAY